MTRLRKPRRNRREVESRLEETIYGMWLTEDGREVIFDRSYKPVVLRYFNNPVVVWEPSSIGREEWFRLAGSGCFRSCVVNDWRLDSLEKTTSRVLGIEEKFRRGEDVRDDMLIVNRPITWPDGVVTPVMIDYAAHPDLHPDAKFSAEKLMRDGISADLLSEMGREFLAMCAKEAEDNRNKIHLVIVDVKDGSG